MRRPTFILSLAIGTLMLLPACGDDVTAPVGDDGQDDRTLYEIHDVDYVRNKYFYIDNPASITGGQPASVRVYRTVTPADLVADPTIVSQSGWAIPDPDGWGFAMHDIVVLLNASQVPTNAVQHDFELLEPGVDYTLTIDPDNAARVIGIELTEAIADTELRTLAVNYLSVDGWTVGGTYQELGVQPTSPGYAAGNLILEMIKAPDPDPQGSFAATWMLEVRSIYEIGITNIDARSLEVTVVDVLNARAEPWQPEGSDIPYMQIFGLDQDGGITGRLDLDRIDLDAGRLYFPSIKAFHPNALNVDTWTGGAFSFTGAYAAQYDVSSAIYSEELTPTRAAEVHQYVIRVLAKATR